MLGTVINSVAIIVGSLFGVALKHGIKESYKTTIMQGIGLSVVVIGLMGALKTEDLMLVIISIVLGSLIGEIIDIEAKLNRVGKALENRFGGEESGIARGFVTASLIYCVGAMAIVGSLESGLTGNHETLMAKSILDGISSIIFSSTLGIGVMFSAMSVFIYQGIITLTATWMKVLLIDAVVVEMSAVGGILIMAIGLNMLEIKRIKVGNMLPAIFIPLIYYMLTLIYHSLLG